MKKIRGLPDTFESDLLIINDYMESMSKQENRAVMLITGSEEDMQIDKYLRNVFVWAILTRTSDVHIQKRSFSNSEHQVLFNLRTGNGFANSCIIENSDAFGDRIRNKMFTLTNTPQGAMTPTMGSSRFKISLPGSLTEAYDLRPADSTHYNIGVRVEYQKAVDGFKFVCRIIDDQQAPQIHNMKMTRAMLDQLLRTIEEPSGLILVSGPTGSGKTTLLNGILGYLNNGQKAIHTLERPVEYTLRGKGPITQVQIEGDITFPKALRSSLRQDPDIILIGEINDEETMEIALQAAQTGHLVFATLHANNAPETISRAIDLTKDKKRDAYRLGTTLRMVIAQRLLTLYEGEIVERNLSRFEKEWLKTNGMGHLETIKEVSNFDGTAKKIGKVPLLESIKVTDQIKQLIRADHLDIVKIFAEASSQSHYETLSMAGVRACSEHGGLFSDVMVLDSNTEAEKFPPLRCALSAQYKLDMQQVSKAFDVYLDAIDDNLHVSLEESLETFSATEKLSLGKKFSHIKPINMEKKTNEA